MNRPSFLDCKEDEQYVCSGDCCTPSNVKRHITSPQEIRAEGRNGEETEGAERKNKVLVSNGRDLKRRTATKVRKGMVKTSEGSWHQGAGGHTGRKWTRQGLHQRFHWGLGCDPSAQSLCPGEHVPVKGTGRGVGWQ